MKIVEPYNNLKHSFNNIGYLIVEMKYNIGLTTKKDGSIMVMYARFKGTASIR